MQYGLIDSVLQQNLDKLSNDAFSKKLQEVAPDILKNNKRTQISLYTDDKKLHRFTIWIKPDDIIDFDDEGIFENSSGMMLSLAIEQMKNAINSTDLSDSYLKKSNRNNETRREVFCGEYCYGITMVPASMILPLLEESLKLHGDRFIYYGP